MLQNVMYDKTDLIDVANKNRVAAVQRAAYQNTLCSPGIGAEPQQGRKYTRSASAVRVFFRVCGYTDLACQYVFHIIIGDKIKIFIILKESLTLLFF